MSPFVLNAWYAAATAEEVGRTPLARSVIGQNLVLYRTGAGAAVALRDRCAHRFAPLSKGQLCGDDVVCPYHGMQYGPDGACTSVPGQERIPPTAVVRSFPVLERYGLVFVWMGSAALANPQALVDIPQYGIPGWGLSRGHAVFKSSLANITDNLIDPAHTTFVHEQTIGNRAGGQVPVAAHEADDGTIVCGRWVDDAPAVPTVQRFAKPAGNVDRWQFYYLKPPCTSWVDFGSLEAGRPHTAEEQSRAPYRVLSYAFLTPIDASTTHYFSFQLRNFHPGDEDVTAELNMLYKATFEEDRELLEAIQREEDRHPGLQPVRIASDTGVVRLRRAHARLLAMEQSPDREEGGQTSGPPV